MRPTRQAAAGARACRCPDPRAHTAQILERISQRLDLFRAGRDADPRQQTLRATISWSHDLLSTDEQRLFARMAVFRGGCTLEAAEEVVDANLDALQSLVDKSLLRHSEERFWMLETIREYAHELLEGSDDADAMRRRHADHYLALGELAYTERFARGLTWVLQARGRARQPPRCARRPA